MGLIVGAAVLAVLILAILLCVSVTPGGNDEQISDLRYTERPVDIVREQPEATAVRPKTQRLVGKDSIVIEPEQVEGKVLKSGMQELVRRKETVIEPEEEDGSVVLKPLPPLTRKPEKVIEPE